MYYYTKIQFINTDIPTTGSTARRWPDKHCQSFRWVKECAAFVTCENTNNILSFPYHRAPVPYLSEAQRCHHFSPKLWQAASQTWDSLSAKLPTRIHFIWSQRRSEMRHLWKMERQSSDGCV